VETTSATVVAVSKADLARVESERDEAREQLQQEITWNAEERATLLAKIQALNERDDLLHAGWLSIDFTEIELMTARDRAAHLPPKQRQALQKAIAKAKTLEVVVEVGTRNLPAVYDANWPASKAQLESDITALHDAVHVLVTVH
jgi:hypothetical protein